MSYNLKSNYLRKFKIFSKICEESKQKIKTFHVFDDIKGYNALFITNDDKVFGFGSNYFGCCGLGHDLSIEEPNFIPELYKKTIKQFFIGSSFVLAINSSNQVFGWGRNEWGELGRGYNTNDNCLKPEIITFAENETIIEVSCGSYHSLALTSNGFVYGWGDNKKGQIGCGTPMGQAIFKPIKLKSFCKLLIKSIYCSFLRSFALTNNGLVYSWGQNDWSSLGHEINRSECIFEPKLINIVNVVSVCPSTNNTYFLTKEGFIYFCGLFEDERHRKSYQKLPKLMDSETKFSSLYSVYTYQEDYQIGTAFNVDFVYFLIQNIIKKTKYNSLFEFYSNKLEITHKTIEII